MTKDEIDKMTEEMSGGGGDEIRLILSYTPYCSH